MQNIKPMGKGDFLCPLGFHPQVRWPTRCKRCFRDYKEHGNRNKEQDYKLKRNDTAASSPSLDSKKNKVNEDKNITSDVKRSWTSTSNLHDEITQLPKPYEMIDSNKSTSSWTSTPDLVQLSDNTRANGDVISVTLPRRKKPTNEVNPEDDYRRTAYTVRRRTSSGLSMKPPIPKSGIYEGATKSRTETFNHVGNAEQKISFLDSKGETESNILAHVSSSINTNDTDTIVNNGLLEEQIESLKLELRNMKRRCEMAEKEKNEMLLRRVASLDTSISTKATVSESSRLREKINNLTETCENLKEEKKSLTNRIRELENKKSAEDLDSEIKSLKSKLRAAESLCEELMDENREMKKELRDMEEEIEEMQDNFRENQDDEYSSIKKELEQTGKNCRILSFKLRKSERKAEQLEAEKVESERKSREAIQKLQKELDDVNEKLRLSAVENARKKAPMLGNIPKTPSGEKVSRASLTRGGSQEDPAQLLRDLQDSIEREADLREQLRYAEEEAQNLRKKVSRVEDDNESLLMQLKKMATKAKIGKSSPTHSRLSNELSVEKDEGISDDDDPTELRLLLELNEQESAVLRKKVEELEENCDILKRKASDLQEKLQAKEQKPCSNSKQNETAKVSEDEVIQELRTKLKDKEKECDQLNAELNSIKKKNKSTAKARSAEGDRDNVDLQRQLKVVEQEASVLRARISSLESENEKLSNENRQLNIAKMSKTLASQTEANLKSKITSLEKQLADTRKLKSKGSEDKSLSEMKELKEKCLFLESENSKLAVSLQQLKEANTDEIKEHHKKRTPKSVTASTSKDTLKMVENLECGVKSATNVCTTELENKFLGTQKSMKKITREEDAQATLKPNAEKLQTDFELEEERMLHSGPTKTAGAKTRMDLLWQKEREEQNRLLKEWQKEREEQNRLLKETSTLARDLRQTLIEVERERDKERLDMKRRLDQMKKNAEEEQEETKKKLHEMLFIISQISDLSKTVPYDYDKGLPPIPTKKQTAAVSRESSIEKRNLSRESSLAREDINSQFQQIVQKLIDIRQQVKVMPSSTTPFDRDTARKVFISRRPASTESDKPHKISSNLQRSGSLYRKCVSLEQTSPTTENYQPIWRTDDDTDGSVSSIQSIDDSYLQKMNHKFDSSFDSRLSGGSTHSEMLPSTLKKKKGILGKLKKLTKSARSIDH